jgi:hypothetical protein
MQIASASCFWASSNSNTVNIKAYLTKPGPSLQKYEGIPPTLLSRAEKVCYKKAYRLPLWLNERPLLL